MLPQINDKGIQYQGCKCPALIQAILYHYELDDDVERTTPYAVRSVLNCVFERRQKIMEKRRKTYIFLKKGDSHVFFDRSALGLQPKSAPAPVLERDLFEAHPQAEQPKGENRIAVAGVKQKDLRLQCEDNEVKKLTVTEVESLLAPSSALQSVSNSKTSYISLFSIPPPNLNF